jgi:two-component system, NarL family, response regulator
LALRPATCSPDGTNVQYQSPAEKYMVVCLARRRLVVAAQQQSCWEDPSPVLQGRLSMACFGEDKDRGQGSWQTAAKKPRNALSSPRRRDSDAFHPSGQSKTPFIVESQSPQSSVADVRGSPSASRDSTRKLTVLIADDHAIVREGLVALVSRQSDMQVVATASNGREAVEQFLATQPDVALVDLRMPVMDGIEAVILLRERMPASRVIVLTTFHAEDDIYRALRAGARGYLLKDVGLAELIDSIRTVSNGGTCIPPGIAGKLADRVATQELTPREMEVLRAVAKGKSNKEIGTALNISEATVKVHVTHILEKLKVSGRTEAIGVAANRGLVHLSDRLAA